MKRDKAIHPKNRLLDFYIKNAPTYSTIVKIEHFENDAPAEINDLQPLVVYSLNKKKRWEIAEDFPLSSEDDDVKSVVVEREIPDLYYAWWSLSNVHSHDCVNHSKPVSSAQLDDARKEDKVIGYHIVRIPKNYKKVFDNKCFRYIGLRYPEFLGYSPPRELTSLQYELKELEEDDGFEMEGFSSDDSESSSSSTRPPDHYNLLDHIVVKQKRKPKGWLTI